MCYSHREVPTEFIPIGSWSTSLQFNFFGVNYCLRFVPLNWTLSK